MCCVGRSAAREAPWRGLRGAAARRPRRASAREQRGRSAGIEAPTRAPALHTQGTDGCTLKPASSAALGTAAELLGCDAAALAKAVTTRTRVTPDGPIVSPLGAKAAAETRDALSKVRGLLFPEFPRPRRDGRGRG